MFYNENSDFFAEILLKWYASEKRDLPWRNTQNPYFVWLSEIILQQTRVAQGWAYYLKFIENYPTISHLATASEEAVLKDWQGLGYYSRARNLHQTAKIIHEKWQGQFPKTYAEMLTLKGVGDYTASAISSICYNEAQAVVDGNVYRVLSRVFGIDMPIDTSQGAKYFKELASVLLKKEEAGTYNQAIMDFGAIQCKPQNPSCMFCVFQEKCVAFSQNSVQKFPVKKGKAKVKNRYFHYFIPIDKAGKTLFRQRTEKDIWQGLYEFPLWETLEPIDNECVISEINKKYSQVISVKKKGKTITHKLSHQHIHTEFWLIHLEDYLLESIDFQEVEMFPTCILIANFLKELEI